MLLDRDCIYVLYYNHIGYYLAQVEYDAVFHRDYLPFVMMYSKDFFCVLSLLYALFFVAEFLPVAFYSLNNAFKSIKKYPDRENRLDFYSLYG